MRFAFDTQAKIVKTLAQAGSRESRVEGVKDIVRARESYEDRSLAMRVLSRSRTHDRDVPITNAAPNDGAMVIPNFLHCAPVVALPMSNEPCVLGGGLDHIRRWLFTTNSELSKFVDRKASLYA